MRVVWKLSYYMIKEKEKHDKTKKEIDKIKYRINDLPPRK